MDSDLESGQSSNGHVWPLKDLMKKIRLNSHTTGDDCKCQRLKCFENVPLDDR